MNSQSGGPKSDKLPNDTEQFTLKTNLRKTQTPKYTLTKKIECVDPI